MLSSRRVILITFFLALLFPAVVLADDTIHVVQPGETLYRISVRYGVSMDIIAQANNISNRERILAGQRLTIPDLTNAVENPLIAAEPIHHIVQPGETLASIANRYGLTVSQLAQINNITNPNRILRGQTLTVFTAPVTADAVEQPAEVEAAAPEAAVPLVEAEAAAEAPAASAGTPYTVKPGEHLAEIAQRFGVTWPAIVQANHITDPNRIQAGQVILIPDARTVTDLGIISPVDLAPSAPSATTSVGKEIIVDLSDSRIYAYENGRLVRSVLASTGLPATPTVKGAFKVQRKYAAQLMSGPGYYLPNVQWIMYFYAGYAIHGTYWHNNFGQPMSHGCVNLPNDEALWFYDWASVGTPVTVQT
ncbi:MAG: LysM peptidoglycan-binding domain-containing protein [Anaerolineae bacterium]|nr:LysM peptidoglycan-binding domain-containing protein [Anaerolineae bacterium]